MTTDYERIENDCHVLFHRVSRAMEVIGNARAEEWQDLYSIQRAIGLAADLARAAGERHAPIDLVPALDTP